MGRYILTTDPATPKVLKRPGLEPLRPFVRGWSKFYVTEAFLKVVDLEHPVYLYLLKRHRDGIEIVAAFHVTHGKARKINR